MTEGETRQSKPRPVHPRDAASLILLDGIGKKNPKSCLASATRR